MTRLNSLFGIALVALLVATAASGAAGAASSPQSLPAAYHGQVTVGGDPAPAGVTVTARVDGEVRDRLTTAADGTYGGAGAFDEKLTVQATDGATVVFYVDGARASSVDWESGDNREVDLSVSSLDGATGDPDAPDSDGGSGGSGAPTGGSGSGAPTGGGDDAPSTSAPDTTRPADAVSVSTTVSPDAPVTVSVSGADTDDVALDALSVSATRETDLDLSVRASRDPPSAEAARDDALAYLSVDHAAEESAFASVNLSFTVRTARVEAAGGAGNVALYRRHGGAWHRLDTESLGRSGDSYRFRAMSPGLSVFAVGTRTAAQASSTTSAVTRTVTTGAPDATETTAVDASTTESESGSDAQTTDSGGVPGFTLAGALVALAGALVALGVRRP